MNNEESQEGIMSIKIKLTIKGQEIELTIQELRDLQMELECLIPKKKDVFPKYPDPKPYYEFPGIVWCKAS